MVKKPADDRTWHEKMQNFIDTFSPVYVNRHTEEEVLGWFRESGFTNPVVAYEERYGFGVRGVLAADPNAKEDAGQVLGLAHVKCNVIQSKSK
jgi:hypothetical protein